MEQVTLTTRTWLYAGYAIAVSIAFAPVLRGLVQFSRADASASHVIVVPLVAAALIFRDRRVIFARPGFGRGVAVAVILAGLALAAGAAWSGTRELTFRLAIAGVVAMWAGGFLLVYGPRAFRAAGFPLFFLMFMVPFPPALLDSVTEMLKVGSTEIVAELFRLTGIPHHRQGFVFSLPSVTIEVADACSGIRSTIALMLTALIAGEVLLQKTWKKALLVLAVVPITIFKNAVRIVSLSLLATYVDPSFLAGRLHHDGGVVFFLMALGLMGPLVAILRHSDAPSDMQRGAVASA